MIEYDREFLVPYLQDICAYHLTERKLDIKIAKLEQNLRKCQIGEYNPKPGKKAEHTVILPGLLVSIVFGYLLFRFIKWSQSIPGFAYFDDSWRLMYRPWHIGWMVVLVVLVSVIIIGLIATFFAVSENKYKKQELKAAQVSYEKRAQYNKELLQYVPGIQKSIHEYKQERKKVHDLLTEAYNVNIIPRNYRGIYPSVYLYDWFSTSRATDLDHALSMFVLEQIKDKLDTIIENQSEMLLNQRVMMANQQKLLSQQKQENNRLRMKLDNMIAGSEEHNRYLRMIESNTAATAYFTAANYIMKL